MTFEQCAIAALAQVDAPQPAKDATLEAARMQMRHMMAQTVDAGMEEQTIAYMVKVLRFVTISEAHGQAVCDLAVKSSVERASRN